MLSSSITKAQSWARIPEMLLHLASVRIFKTELHLASSCMFPKIKFAYFRFRVIAHRICILTSHAFHTLTSFGPLPRPPLRLAVKYLRVQHGVVSKVGGVIGWGEVALGGGGEEGMGESIPCYIVLDSVV